MTNESNYKNGYAIFPIDLNIIESALAGYGVLQTGSMCSTTAQASSLIINYGEGSVVTSKSTYDITSGSLTLSDYQHSVLPRKVLIYIDADDGTVKPSVGVQEQPSPFTASGRLAKKPVPPDFDGGYTYGTISYGDVILSEVWLPPSGTSLSASSITDRRNLVKPFSGVREEDVIIYRDGTTYIALNGKTGMQITTSTDIDAIWSTSLALFPNSKIIEKNGTAASGSFDPYYSYYAPHVSENNFRNGILYDEAKRLEMPVWIDPDIVISCFDGIDTWSVSNNIGDEEYVTTSTYVHSGEASLHFVAPPNSGSSLYVSLVKDFSTSVDIRRMNFKIRFYTEDIDNFHGINCMFTSDDAWTNYMACYFTYPVNYHLEGSTSNGWVEMFMEPLTSAATYVGNVQMDAIKHVKLWVFGSDEEENTDFYMDEFLGYRNRLRRGTIVFTQDEGQLCWEYTRPVADRHGKRVSLCWHGANWSASGVDPNIRENLAKLARYKGWDIGSHGYEHVDMGWATRNDAIRRHLFDLRAMDYYGMHTNNKCFITAGGSCGYEHGLSQRVYGYLNRSTLSSYIGFPCGMPFALPCPQDPTLANAKSYVDAVEENGLLAIILVHTITQPYGGGNWSDDELEEFFDYCDEKNVDVLSLSDLVYAYLWRGKNKDPFDGIMVTVDSK